MRGGAERGGASARGAGRARARRRGGSARAAPKRAELGGARERQAEPGRLPAAQRPSCYVAGLRLPPTSAQAPAKLLFSWAPPGCLKESEHSAGSALLCSSGNRADVHPSPAGLSRSAPPHLLITPRSDKGAPTEGPRGRQRPRTPSLTAADLPRATLTSSFSPDQAPAAAAATSAVSAAAASQRGAGSGGGAGGGHRRGCAGLGPQGRRGWETKGKLLLFAVRDRSSLLDLLPPPSVAAPPPSPRAVPAVLRDPASLRGARRCWCLRL